MTEYLLTVEQESTAMVAALVYIIYYLVINNFDLMAIK